MNAANLLYSLSASYLTLAAAQPDLKNNSLVKDIQVIVNFMAAGVAVVVVIMIIVGGIQYTMAGNQPQVVANARKKLINALFALIMFMLTYAFLQWIIPGGIFN